MTQVNNLTIESLNRDCIASPASWTGRTSDGGSIYIRFRWGTLSLRYSTELTDEDYVPKENEIYNEQMGDDLDGYLSPGDIRLKLEDIGVTVEDTLPETFYADIPVEECDLMLFGNWITEVTCNDCDWRLDGDELEKYEYESVIPRKCPKCAESTTVETEKPDRFKREGKKPTAETLGLETDQ